MRVLNSHISLDIIICVIIYGSYQDDVDILVLLGTTIRLVGTFFIIPFLRFYKSW
jgi:hypothetical protein